MQITYHIHYIYNINKPQNIGFLIYYYYNNILLDRVVTMDDTKTQSD